MKVDANEDQIKERIRLLMTFSKDRGLMSVALKIRISELYK